VSPDGAKGGVLSVMANAHDTKAKHPTVMHAPIAMIPEMTGRIAIYIRGSTWSDKAMYVFIRDFRFTFDLNSPSGPNGLALEGLAGFGPQFFQRRGEGSVSHLVGAQRPEMPLPPVLPTGRRNAILGPAFAILLLIYAVGIWAAKAVGGADGLFLCGLYVPINLVSFTIKLPNGDSRLSWALSTLRSRSAFRRFCDSAHAPAGRA
jgi:hypothetical protein